MTAVALVLLAAAVLLLAVQVRRLRAEVAVMAARLAAIRIVEEASRPVAVRPAGRPAPVPRDEE